MSGVIISSSLVITAGDDDLNSNSPIIGYQNLTTAANISATTEAAGFPATNMANPATHLKWKANSSGVEYITITIDSPEDIDYLAVAAHNFGTNLTAVSVEGYVSGWIELIPQHLLPNDGPVIFRFTPQAFYAIRLVIQPSVAAVPVARRAAVVYVGELLSLQRRLYVGHTPITYGRKTMIANPRSMSGAFLGRIVVGEKVGTSVALQNLTASWYRAYMEPFLQVAKESPFFFAWRPGTYPNETGYTWLADDPVPTNQSPNGMMQITLELEGVV
jgi:hypothetical protein